ncbi:hypothetical protein [Streptomyces sp. AA4]|uniref:hypothetical protein n=1 Tax=Actinomycetes TaxID=1760 RepID=UPI0001B55BE2
MTAAASGIWLKDRVAQVGDFLDSEVVRRLVAHTSHADRKSAVEKHANAIFDKLDLPLAKGYSRRVLAVLRCLGS